MKSGCVLPTAPSWDSARPLGGSMETVAKTRVILYWYLLSCQITAFFFKGLQRSWGDFQRPLGPRSRSITQRSGPQIIWKANPKQRWIETGCYRYPTSLISRGRLLLLLQDPAVPYPAFGGRPLPWANKETLIASPSPWTPHKIRLARPAALLLSASILLLATLASQRQGS